MRAYFLQAKRGKEITLGQTKQQPNLHMLYEISHQKGFEDLVTLILLAYDPAAGKQWWVSILNQVWVLQWGSGSFYGFNPPPPKKNAVV